MSAAEPISGEIERLLRVEQEIETLLEGARREAAAIKKEGDIDGAARERERLRALEEEIAHRQRELVLSARAEIEKVLSAAEAQAGRYDLTPARIAAFAERITQVLAGDEP